jgi:hypothetical protein
MERAPIAYFAYNRPEHTLRSLLSLADNPEARESALFIYCDALKKEEHRERVDEVHRIVRSRQWCGSVHIIEHEENKGCAQSIISGVTQMSDTYGKVIVIEDDLVLSPHFLGYMNTALSLYESDPQVMQISGHMFPIAFDCKKDALFLPFITSWGWATWQRAWRLFDPHMSGYGQIKGNRKMRYRFNMQGEYPYSKMLESQLRGEIDSWAIRWYLSVFLNNGLTLYPVTSLVENIGFDGSGVHCPNRSDVQHLHHRAPVTVFPATVRVDKDNLHKFTSYFNATSRTRPSLSSLFKRVQSHMRALCK